MVIARLSFRIDADGSDQDSQLLRCPVVMEHAQPDRLIPIVLQSACLSHPRFSTIVTLSSPFRLSAISMNLLSSLSVPQCLK